MRCKICTVKSFNKISHLGFQTVSWSSTRTKILFFLIFFLCVVCCKYLVCKQHILLRKFIYMSSDRYAEIPDGGDAMRVTVKTLKLLERWLPLSRACRASHPTNTQKATLLWLGGREERSHWHDFIRKSITKILYL